MGTRQLQRMSRPITLFVLLLSAIFGACVSVPSTLLAGTSAYDQLAIAVLSDDSAKAQQLLDSGLDVNIRNEQGTTALMIASGTLITDSERQTLGNRETEENSEMVALLLEYGAEPDLMNNVGQTALLSAIYHGWRRTAERLLKSGANANGSDEFDWTPIMYAALHCYADIVQLLLENGADPALANKHGNTVTSIAKENDCARAIEILSSEGG